jgi:hypothetical protein
LEDETKKERRLDFRGAVLFSAQLVLRGALRHIRHVQVMMPAPDIAHVLGVSACVADAVHALGLVVAVAVTVTFCEAEKPCPDPLHEYYRPPLSAA